MDTGYQVIERGDGACVIDAGGNAVKCFDSHPQAMSLHSVLNSDAWVAPANVREVLMNCCAPAVGMPAGGVQSVGMAWAEHLGRGKPITRRRAKQWVEYWNAKGDKCDDSSNVWGGCEAGREWAKTLSAQMDAVADLRVPISASVIDVRFIPHDTRDSDGKYFSDRTNHHLLEVIPYPSVLEYHGLAFGGDVRNPGYVMSRWADETGHWAAIEMDPTHPFYDEYLSLAAEGRLFVSSGGSPSYFRVNKEGLVTDWATIEISFVRAKDGMRPKNWYAVAKPREQFVLNAARAHTRIGKTRLALIEFMVKLGFDRKAVEGFVGEVEVSTEDVNGNEVELEFEIDPAAEQDASAQDRTDTDANDGDASTSKSAGHPQVVKEVIERSTMSQTDIEALNARIADLQAGLDAATARAQTADDQLAVLNGQHAAIITERDALAAQISAVTTELESLRGDLRARDEQYNALNSQLEVLNGRVQTQDAELVAAREADQVRADEAWLNGLGARVQHGERVAILARLKEARAADVVLNSNGSQVAALKEAYESRAVPAEGGTFIAGFGKPDKQVDGAAPEVVNSILAATPWGQAALKNKAATAKQ